MIVGLLTVDKLRRSFTDIHNRVGKDLFHTSTSSTEGPPDAAIVDPNTLSPLAAAGIPVTQLVAGGAGCAGSPAGMSLQINLYSVINRLLYVNLNST